MFLRDVNGFSSQTNRNGNVKLCVQAYVANPKKLDAASFAKASRLAERAEWHD
jgi:hypothetical protein